MSRSTFNARAVIQAKNETINNLQQQLNWFQSFMNPKLDQIQITLNTIVENIHAFVNEHGVNNNDSDTEEKGDDPNSDLDMDNDFEQWFKVAKITRRRFRAGEWEYFTHWKCSWISNSSQFNVPEHVKEVLHIRGDMLFVKWQPTWVVASDFA